MTTATDIVIEGRSWVGTPYRHHGRDKGHACDCVGLIVGIAEHLMGERLYARFDYSDHPKAEKLLTEVGKALDEQIDRVQPGALPVLCPGEIVAVYVNSHKLPQHLGLIGEYQGRLTLIHAFNKNKKVVEHSLTRWWHQRVCRVYRYPNVIYGG